ELEGDTLKIGYAYPGRRRPTEFASKADPPTGLVVLRREPPDKGRPKPDGEGQARADRYGDPLPPGALVRMGTTRCRPGSMTYCLAFSANGKTVVTAGRLLGIRLWDITTGKEIRQFAADQHGFRSLALSSDGETLASGNWEGKIRLWEVAT